MESVLDFMYQGQIELSETELPEFLAVAKKLQLKGLNRYHQTMGRAPQRLKRPAQTSVSETESSKKPKVVQELVQVVKTAPVSMVESMGMASMVAESPMIWTSMEVPEKLDPPSTNIIETSVSSVTDGDANVITTTVNMTVKRPEDEIVQGQETEIHQASEVPIVAEEVSMTQEEREKAERAEYFESIYKQGAIVGPNGLSGEQYCFTLFVVIDRRPEPISHFKIINNTHGIEFVHSEILLDQRSRDRIKDRFFFQTPFSACLLSDLRGITGGAFGLSLSIYIVRRW